MDWTEKTLARAAKLWSDGWSAAQIGVTIGVSRNAVLGKVHRNRPLFPARAPGRMLGARPAAAKPRRPSPLRPKLALLASGLRPRRDAPPPAPKDLPADIRAVAIVPQPFVRLGRGQCRFPMAGAVAGPMMLCCGLAVADHQALPGNRRASHCPGHLKLSCGRGTSGERSAADIKRTVWS